jgi:hypothetical protein
MCFAKTRLLFSLSSQRKYLIVSSSSFNIKSGVAFPKFLLFILALIGAGVVASPNKSEKV